MPFRLTRSAAAIVLTACSVAVATGGAVAAAHGRSSAAIQLTGRQLSALLVPMTALPHGYRVQSNILRDSGTRLETAPGTYNLAAMSCAAIYDDNGKAGFGESAFAEVGYVKVSGIHGTGLIQQVYQFRTANAAASFWGGLLAITKRCPGLGMATAVDAGKITQHVTASRFGSDKAFETDIAETQSQSGSVAMAMLTVLAGDDVFTVGKVGYGRLVPADPAIQTLMRELVNRVRSAS